VLPLIPDLNSIATAHLRLIERLIGELQRPVSEMFGASIMRTIGYDATHDLAGCARVLE
jgi:hypothetical protein